MGPGGLGAKRTGRVFDAVGGNFGGACLRRSDSFGCGCVWLQTAGVDFDGWGKLRHGNFRGSSWCILAGTMPALRLRRIEGCNVVLITGGDGPVRSGK